MQFYFGIKRMSNCFSTACALKNLGYFTAQFKEVLPLGFQTFIQIFFSDFRPRHHLHAFRHISWLFS